MNELTLGISIYVEDSGRTYHTLDDMGLALGNNNYIGDPEMETTYIQVPGRTGLIDATEAISGRRIYKKRQLSFELGGVRERLSWDAVISAFRNNINGRVCRLILDNDPGYFWRGRVYIKDFDRFRELGTFTLSVPTADPYKYALTSSSEPWLWDPFNFETDMITYIGAITVSGTQTVTIPHGHMATTPEIVVSDKGSSTFTVTVNSVTYTLAV
ncbi:MAG: phage tail family protein, partial [Clostridiales bacterium]|nr:phage tail family protein [Clostridiales bacterium]MBQ1571547.1 phage tail family protein [Clostridiales bacterium]